MIAFFVNTLPINAWIQNHNALILTEKTMLASVTTKYGSPEVLSVTQVDKPTPQPNEIIVHVAASSVTAADIMMRRGSSWYGRLFLGLFKPKNSVSGTGFAGEVSAVGTQVENFKIGDRVFGESVFGHGSNAEFTCIPCDGIVTNIPDGVSLEAAATVCDGPLTSMNFLTRLVNLRPGQRVLINGASGSLGTAAVQLAKNLGVHVTAVCSASNEEMVRALGADEVIDYNDVDFTISGKRWDVIYDTVGKSSFAKCKPVLTNGGAYLSPVLGGTVWAMLWTSLFGTKKAHFSATGALPKPVLKALLRDVRERLDHGDLEMVIDRKYQLDQVVEAHRYVETGHKKGNVVLVC